MESVEASVKYITYDYVEAIEERFIDRYVSGVGKDAVFIKQSIGWYLVRRDSRLASYISNVKPDFTVGDKIKITLEKAQATCPPSPSTNQTTTPSSLSKETPAQARPEP